MKQFYLFFLALMTFGVGVGQTTWTYDFGTGTANNSNSGSGNLNFFSGTPSGGGTYRVRIGTQGGSLILANPGTSLGSGTEAQLTAATGGSSNKFTVYNWNAPSNVLNFKFKMRTTSSGNGVLVLHVGNGIGLFTDNNSYTSYNNSIATLLMNYSSGNITSVQRRIDGSFTNINASGIVKDSNQEIQIFANNAASSTTYNNLGVNNLNAQSWDMWVDGEKISPNGGWPKSGTLAAGNILGFGFFAESSTSNAATLYLDDLEYSNALPTLSPTITSSVAALDNFGNINVGEQSASNSFTVSGTDLTANVTVTAPTHFEVSADDINFSNEIVLNRSGGTLVGQPVTVFTRFSPITTGTKSDNITLTSSGADTVNVTVSGSGTSANSASSDIIENASFSYPQNIDYANFQESSSLTTTNSIEVARFTIRDGGTSADTDELATILNEITFEVTDVNSVIRTIALFDGTVNLGEVTTSNLLNFIGLTLTANDDDTKDFSLYATFNSTVIDNSRFSFKINETLTDSDGSLMINSSAGGATTSIAGDDNRIEVTATDLIFDQNVTDVQIGDVMSPSPSVLAVDVNANIDLDYSELITLTPSTAGIFDATATTSIAAVNGFVLFSNLVFDTVGIDFTLEANSVALNADTSLAFNVLSAPVLGWQITATNTEFIIDFDNTVDGVNNEAFNGTGFTPAPIPGQLNSNAWAVTGLSEGILNFGDTQAAGDFARGSSTGGVTTGGLYAFETSTGNASLGVQPGGLDFAPGAITLRAQNQTGATVTAINLAYIIYVLNDQGRSNSFNFAYSSDDISYTDIPSLDYISPEIADASPAWISNSRSTSITSLSIEDGDYFYLRWTGADVSGNGSRDEFALDDIKVIFNPPTTYTFNGTWSPSDPNGASTITENIVISSGNASISANTDANSITINPGAGLTVDSGVTLTVAETLNLESVSDNYSSLILNGTINGTVNYNRYTNVAGTGTSGGNDLVAPPLSGQTFGDFAAANDGVLAASGDVRAFAPFNNTASAYQNFNVTTNSATTLEAGKGYRAATVDGAPLTFSGNVETGTVNASITSETGTFGDWNLIGNPYPSYINIQDFLAHEVEGVSNINLMKDASGIYGYDGDARDGWDVITQANAPGRLMAPGQGFFVAADVAASLQFTPAMRVAGSGDDFIPGRTAPLTYLKLVASNGTNRYKTDIYFNANATAGLDPGYDAQIWGGQNSGFILYSHLVENNTGMPLALQALGMDALNNVSIPLGVNATAGSNLEFSILESQLPTSTQVYLEDTVNNTVTLINDSDAIVNLNNNVNGTGRFFLRFTNNALSITDELAKRLNIYHQNTEQVIVIAGQLANNTQAYLYDLQGRVVSTTVLRASQTEQRVDVSNLSNGVYVLSFENGAERISKKLIIR